MFSGCTVPPDSKETKLESSDQEVSPSAGKYTKVVLVAHVSVSLQLFPMVKIFLRFLGLICFDKLVLKESHKNYFKNWCLVNSQPTFLFWTYF